MIRSPQSKNDVRDCCTVPAHFKRRFFEMWKNSARHKRGLPELDRIEGGLARLSNVIFDKQSELGWRVGAVHDVGFEPLGEYGVDVILEGFPYGMLGLGREIGRETVEGALFD